MEKLIVLINLKPSAYINNIIRTYRVATTNRLEQIISQSTSHV